MRPTGKEGRGPREQKTQRRRRSWAAGRAERRHERHLETPPKSLWYAKSRSLKWLSWQAFIVPETKTTHFSEITFLCMRNAQLQQPSYKLLTGLQQRRRRRRSCTNPQIYTRGNAEFSVSSRLKEVRPKKLCEWGRSHWRRYPGRWQKSHLWGFFFLSFYIRNDTEFIRTKFISSVRLVCLSFMYLKNCWADLLHTFVWFCQRFWMFFGLEEKQQVLQSHHLVLVVERRVPARRNSSSSQTNLGMQLQAWIYSFTPRPPPPPSLWAITHGDISVSVSVSVRDDTHLHAGVCEWLVAF